MRAYRKTSTQHRFCVYLTEVEWADLVAEMETCQHRDNRPVMFKLLRHLKAPREGEQ